MSFGLDFRATFCEPWEGFYAIGVLDGQALHLKEAPKNDADGYIIGFGGRPAAG